MRALVAALAIALPACSGTPCPNLPPDDGTACSVAGLQCEYAGDAHGRCTLFATCSGGAWAVRFDPTCSSTNALGCPASFADAKGLCADATLRQCDFTEGRCACDPCAGAATTMLAWQCRAWSDVPAGCPAQRPLLGTSCGSAGLKCSYAVCCGLVDLGPRMECTDGRWQSYADTSCRCVPPQPMCPTM